LRGGQGFAKQFPAAVVDGQVFGALLAEQLQDTFGPRATVRSLHFRFKNLVFAGETVRCSARVSDMTADPDGDGDLVVVESVVEVVDGQGEVDRVAVAPAGAIVAVRQ
jgi:acyl dehydratase